MRRISTGVQGRPILGNFFTETNTFSTRETNQDIVLEPNGAGIISAESDLRIDGAGSLVFRDSDNNNTITIESPAISSDYTLTLPTGTGTAGDVLTVDGSGNLSFTDLSIEVGNQTADTTTYYPLLSTSNSGSISSVDVSSSKLTFQPSTGTLTSTLLTDGTLTISNGSISNAVNASFSGTMTASSITETSSIVLKDNVRSLHSVIDRITKLDGVQYVRKSTGNQEIGLIAEDVAKIIPELVSIDKAGNPVGVQYTKITAFLIEAIKILKQDIDKLKGSNNG